MESVNRKVTYRMYPGKVQEEALLNLLGLHQRVYNTALEERIRVYQETAQSTSFAGQCKDLTQWRKQCESLAGVNAQSLQVTLKRLDLAYQAFFRRIKAGVGEPGFPRFKPIQRFTGWGYKTHGDGWRLHAGEKMKHGHIRLSGVGMVKLRGTARQAGTPKTCEILHKAGKWYVSVTIECSPQRTCGIEAMGLDWGLETFATICDNSGVTHPIANPRHLRQELAKLKLLQQSVSRKKSKRSNSRRKAVEWVAKLHAKVANKRKDFNHKTAATLVEKYGLISTEALSVKNMTASGGEYKKGLNREILSAAPTQFLNLLKSKAEEAGAVWVEVPTRQVKPSQTCHRCGTQRKKLLSERQHSCDCGASCGRDENAARVMLNWALFGNATGQESGRGGESLNLAMLNHETPSITALAA
jgi:putative transposase